VDRCFGRSEGKCVDVKRVVNVMAFHSTGVECFELCVCICVFRLCVFAFIFTFDCAYACVCALVCA